MILNRRMLLQLAGLAPFARLTPAFADDDLKFGHAISLFDDVKYPAGFRAYDYVRTDAPKGGRIRMPAYGTFDSLNPYTINGDPAGVAIHDTLMVRSLDEPSTMYGLIAEQIAWPDDKSRVVFKLNPNAKFHDGQPITPDDVIFSLNTLKANLATQAAYYQNVDKVEQTGDHEVTFVFSQKNNRELPSIVAELPVLPKHWWNAPGADGKPRDTNAASLEIPLGSGAYKIKSMTAGSSIVLERVQDYWAKDLPVNVGQNNFDEIQYLYFQSQQVAFEGFKGDQYDYQFETSSKQWATGYDFPAVTDKKVVKESIALKQVHGMQGYVLNLRKPKFQDIRVRQAMNLAFNFEWSNANLFYGIYKRSRSYFNGSDMEATGLPSPEELELLNPLKDRIPAEVFTTEYANPLNTDPGAVRKNLQAAAKLLEAAGWKADTSGGKRVLKNDKGELLSVEFSLDSPLFERITLPYQQQLELLGFTVTVRTLDDAQMTQRKQTFDYDVMVNVYGQSLSPGNEQRFFWGSSEADKNGSQNYAGIKNEAIDALIDKLIFVKDRKELITACRALDRVLIWNTYIIPQWFSDSDRIAYWDRFGRPEKTADYELGVPTTWWFDADKAKKISG